MCVLHFSRDKHCVYISFVIEQKLTDTKARLESLEQEKLKALPPDATKEINALKQRLVGIRILMIPKKHISNV